MADEPRTCTECPNPVTGRKLTCSGACRSARSTRIRGNRASGREVNTLVTDDAEAAAQELLREELRPAVREAITDDVVQQVQALVGSLPIAVARAVADLDSDDADLRQRAYLAIFKHTLGNKSVLPDLNDEAGQDLIVHFNLPRPDKPDNVTGSGNPDTIESKECDSCHINKPTSEFVGLSDRCTECFDKMRDTAKEILGSEAVDQLES